MRNWLNFHYSTEKFEKLYIDWLFSSKAYVSARKFQELCAMTLRGDAKFKGKLTCGLKNSIMNLVNFHASSRKSKNLHLDWLLLSKAYRDLEEKSTKEFCLMTLKSDAKFEEKLTLGSKKDRNSVNFNASSGKSESLHCDVLLLSVAYKYSAKKVQKNHLS